MKNKKPIVHNVGQYTSQRGLAQACKTTPQTIARIAASIGVGRKGKYTNSPMTFTEDEGIRVATAVFDERAGAARNEELRLKAECVRYGKMLARLAPLAAAMGHPAAEQLREIGIAVAGIEDKPDVKSIEGKTRFLNTVNPHFSKLVGAVNALVAVNSKA